MTIKNDEIDFREYEYKIDLGHVGSHLVERRFALKNKESVTIRVEVDEHETTLKQINEKSIRRAIEILQTFLPKA